MTHIDLNPRFYIKSLTDILGFRTKKMKFLGARAKLKQKLMLSVSNMVGFKRKSVEWLT